MLEFAVRFVSDDADTSEKSLDEKKRDDKKYPPCDFRYANWADNPRMTKRCKSKYFNQYACKNTVGCKWFGEDCDWDCRDWQRRHKYWKGYVGQMLS